MKHTTRLQVCLIASLLISGLASIPNKGFAQELVRPLFKDGVPPKNRKEIQVILIKRIEEELTAKKYVLTKEGRAFLLKQLVKSADTILSDVKNEKFSKAKVEETEKNLKRFVNDLFKRGAETKKINVEIIEKTLFSLCPLYPICRSGPWTRQPNLVFSSRAIFTPC